MDILSLRKKLDSGEVSSEDLFIESNKLAHQYQEEYNSFVTIIDNRDSLCFKR